MNILAIDTATELLCLGLITRGADGGTETRELCVDAGLRHAELLFDHIDRLLELAGLDRRSLNGIVTCRGPGSFTGLRIGMAAAKGIAEALGVPVASVSSLDALAWRHRRWPGTVLALTDARKNRFYAAAYRDGHRLGSHQDLDAPGIADWLSLSSPDGAAVPASSPLFVTGPHTSLFMERLGALPVDDPRRTRFAWAPDPLPRKGWGLELAELGRKRIEEGNWDPVDFGPEYVRASDAELGITAPKGA